MSLVSDQRKADIAALKAQHAEMLAALKAAAAVMSGAEMTKSSLIDALQKVYAAINHAEVKP